MHRVRAGCSVSSHLQKSKVPLCTRAVWQRSYSTALPEDSDGLSKPSYALELLKAYDRGSPTPIDHKNPKIVVPIKPFQAKPTPESEPWLFLMGVFPKSVQDLNKEAELKKLNPPGSEFHGVWLKSKDLEAAKRDRFAKELINFRATYEKPVVDAFREVDMAVHAEDTQRKFQNRMKRRKQHKKNHKKVQPGSTLMRYMEEKDYWEKFASVVKLGDFGDLPPMSEEALKNEITKPAYDYDLIKGDYGQHSDWTVSSYLASMIPEDEVEHLQFDSILNSQFIDQLYRTVKELEHVYAPLAPKLAAISKFQDDVDADKKAFLENKKKEIPPDVWGHIFNPEYITEFDDIEDPDAVSLEEIDYRMEIAYENWTKRLLDPEVEQRVKHYVRNLTSGDTWSKFSFTGNNRLHQFADEAIANQRIFLRDADVVRVLKGQLVDCGLAKIVIKRKAAAAAQAQAATTEAQQTTGAAGVTEGVVGETTPAAGSGVILPSTADKNSGQFFELNSEVVERSVPKEREKSVILTDDEDAYYEFVPTYQDKGTVVLPPKPKKEKVISKQGLESQFQAQVTKLDDRYANQRHLPIKKKEKYWPAVENLIKFDNLDSAEMADMYENESEALEAHQAYVKWRQIWPHPQIGTEDLEGKALEEFMKSDRWYPVNHLHYNHNVEFFTRTLPITLEMKPAERARLRKVVMRVYVAPLELPPVVDKRLKQLLGPRYNQPAKIVTLTGSDRHKQSDNKAYLKLLFREILHEAWLADPNYVPTYAEDEEPTYDWTPSAAASEVTKPVLFRLYGTQLQSYSESAQKSVKAIEQVINNPQTFNYPPLTPTPSEHAERRTLALQRTEERHKIEAAEKQAERDAKKEELRKKAEERQAHPLSPQEKAKVEQYQKNLKQVKEASAKTQIRRKPLPANAFYKTDEDVTGYPENR